MAHINPAIAEPLASADAKRVAEKRRSEASPDPTSGARRTSSFTGEIITHQGRLSYLQNRLEQTIDNAFRDLSSGNDQRTPQIDAYQQTDIAFTPQKAADHVVSRALSHFKDFRADNPGFNEPEAIQAFVQRVRQAVGEGFRDAIALMGRLGAMNPETGRKFEATAAGIRKQFDALSAAYPVVAPPAAAESTD